MFSFSWMISCLDCADVFRGNLKFDAGIQVEQRRVLSWAVKLSIDGERPKTYEVDVDSVPI